jgi:uncharacterized protein
MADFSTFLFPGVRVIERTAGVRPSNITSHNTIYMIGSGTIGDFNEPTLVRSLIDFSNQFGGSLSENSIKLLFRNNRSAICYFIRAGIGAQNTVKIDTAAAGAYTLTINGTAVTYTAISANAKADIVAGLIAAINASAAAATVTASSGAAVDELKIRVDNPITTLTVAVTAGGATKTVTTPLTLQAADYVAAVENSFDYEEDWPQGFLICPEAFQTLTGSTDRLAVGAAMEGLAADENFDWKALVDCGPVHNTVAQVQTDGQQYNSPQGHTDYFAPYVKDLEGNIVPCSAGISGLGTKRFSEEGIHQPMAGAKYPMQGVVDVDVRFGNQDQSVLNPLGINLVRYLRNKGVVSWAMRTRSSDNFYRMSTTRVVLNVLNGSIRRGLDFELFNSIDGRGVQLARIEDAVRSICRRMWISKALYGNTAAEAFEVRCSAENNDGDQLENGNVLVEVWVAPAPAVEKVLVNTFRTSIGKVQESAAAGLVVNE